MTDDVLHCLDSRQNNVHPIHIRLEVWPWATGRRKRKQCSFSLTAALYDGLAVTHFVDREALLDTQHRRDELCEFLNHQKQFLGRSFQLFERPSVRAVDGCSQ